MHLAALATLLLAAGLAGGVLAANPAHSREAKSSGPLEVSQGEILALQISSEGVAAIEATMNDQPVYFFPSEDGKYRALIGADVEAKPGVARLLVRTITSGGASQEKQFDVHIKAKAFKQESFTVAAQYDQFTPELLERIRRERDQFTQAYKSAAPKRYWDGPFISPLPVEITSPFGYRRIINGTPRSPHSGTDLRAAMGTEVAVSNHGRVVLTGDFYFAGKTVLVDHGAGVMTMYLHLSEIKVAQGADVRKGDVIALSGMSGRVTGPHLHWGARVGGARVDPLELVEKLGGTHNKTSPASAGSPEK